MTDVLNAIDNAKTDDKIQGISILKNQSNLGLAQSQAIRKKLADFKKSGKFVVAYRKITYDPVGKTIQIGNKTHFNSNFYINYIFYLFIYK